MERNALSLTLYTAHPPDSCSAPHSWNRQLTRRQNQTTHTGSLTHLSDLVQQLVVLLPFLQGAQIATHPSCQGNGAVVPLECARFSGCFAAVCMCGCVRVCVSARAPLWGRNTLRLLFSGIPLASSSSATPPRCQTRIRQSWTCACVRLFVGVLSAAGTNT